MFRFLSGRKARNTAQNGTHDIKSSKSAHNRNLIQCKVILLDGTDLSVELSVSFFFVYFDQLCGWILQYYCICER